MHAPGSAVRAAACRVAAPAARAVTTAAAAPRVLRATALCGRCVGSAAWAWGGATPSLGLLGHS